jgi:hypothetical protein
MWCPSNGVAMGDAGKEPQREIKRRHKITLEQYAQLEEKFKREQTRAQQLLKENNELKAEIEKAERRIRKLERANPVAAKRNILVIFQKPWPNSRRGIMCCRKRIWLRLRKFWTTTGAV